MSKTQKMLPTTRARVKSSWRTCSTPLKVGCGHAEMKDSNPKAAIEQYLLLLDSEEPQTEKNWSAKCINEIITLKVKKQDLADIDQVVSKLLTYINNMSRYDRGITTDCIFSAVSKIGDLEKKKQVAQGHSRLSRRCCVSSRRKTWR